MEGGGLTDPQAKPLPYQLPQPVSCHLWTHILHAIISCMRHVVSYLWVLVNVFPRTQLSTHGFDQAHFIILWGQLRFHPSSKPSRSLQIGQNSFFSDL